MRKIFSIAFSLGLCGHLLGQITVTSSSFPAAGDTLRIAFDTIAAGITISPPGGNQNWDFSNLTASLTRLQTVKPASEGGAAADFPSANLVIIGALDGESYYNASGSAFQLVGFSGGDQIGFGLDVVTSFNPPLVERRAPMNFFDVNSTNGALLVPFAASELPAALLSLFPFPPDSIRLRLALNRVDIVDGWGTLSIPGGTYPVLRERRTEYTDTRIDIKIGVLPWTDITALVPIPGAGLGRDTTLSYHFFSNTEKEPIAVVNADHITNQVLSVEYKFNGIISNSYDLSSGSPWVEVFPNPAVNDVQVVLHNLIPDLYEFRLINLAGQTVRRELISSALPTTTLQVDLQGVDAGFYLYSLRNQTGKQAFAGKLVVQPR